MPVFALHFIYLLFSFLLGSLPFGIWVARFYGVQSLRTEGSGNIGATNVSRVVGFWPAGVITFLLDASKGILLIVPLLLEWIPAEYRPGSHSFLWWIGFAAVLGHCFSPWLRFRGGKGVATAFGILLLLAPWSGLFAGATFGITYLVTRVGAAASLLGLLSALVTYRLFYPYSSALVVLGLIYYLVVLRHDSNLDQLLSESTDVNAPEGLQVRG